MKPVHRGAEPPTLLSLTSTFPRWAGDTEPGFVLALNRRLQGAFRVVVLAPHAPRARACETMEGVEVRRYHYFWAVGEILAYEGGIMSRLRSRPVAWLLMPLFLLAQVAATVRALRALPVAVIHAHWLIPQALCAIVARGLLRRHVPIVCTVHGTDLFGFRSPVLKRLQRFLANRCALVAAVSDAVRAGLIERGVRAELIQVLPMGVPEATSVPGAARDPRRIVCVGRLVAGKGVDVLLRAFKSVRDRHPDLILTIAGDGVERSRLEALARQLGLDGRVEFRGAVSHAAVMAHFGAASLAVMPSFAEGLGLTALEAMAAGCPLIASDLPALRTFVQPGANGMLFPAGDVAALATLILQVLDDAGLRARLARAGRETVHRQFGWDHAAKRYRVALRDVAVPERRVPV